MSASPSQAARVSDLRKGVIVAGLRSQVKKVWSEQQTRYDALVVKYDALTATLANQELDPAAQAEVEGFKTDLKGFDDSIPDTTA